MISIFPCNEFDEKIHFLHKVTTPYSLKNATCFSTFVERIKCHCLQYCFILSDYILYFKIVIDSVQVHLKINIKYSSIFFNQWVDENDCFLYLCECRETCVFDVFHPLPSGGKAPKFLVRWCYQIPHYPLHFFLCKQLNCKSVNVFIWQSYDFLSFYLFKIDYFSYTTYPIIFPLSILPCSFPPSLL